MCEICFYCSFSLKTFRNCHHLRCLGAGEMTLATLPGNLSRLEGLQVLLKADAGKAAEIAKMRTEKIAAMIMDPKGSGEPVSLPPLLNDSIANAWWHRHLMSYLVWSVNGKCVKRGLQGIAAVEVRFFPCARQTGKPLFTVCQVLLFRLQAHGWSWTGRCCPMSESTQKCILGYAA